MNRRTELTIATLADCAYPLAQEYVAEYLRDAERGGPAATIRVPWLPFAHRTVALTFGLHAGVPGNGAAHDEVRFHWTSGSPLLPDFRGTIRFNAEDGKTLVTVAGDYAAPLGLIGGAFDRIAGRRMALSSLTELAGRISDYLTERRRDWSAAHPA
jgi:hypothetical protein